MKENTDTNSDVTNANIYRSDKKFWTIFIQNKGLTTELALTGFLLLTFQLTLVDKLWDPLVFDKLLDNWNEHPFVEMKILDFTSKEYDEYWAGNYKDSAKLNFKCP